MKNMFGKYELLERLGKGGMAEVYLARLAGPMGVSRFVALKRMLTDIGSDKLSQMFVDEVRLAVRLTHPNIVAVYDFGLEGESYYLAMEFVEGKDVHQILKHASRAQPPAIDVECALYVIAQVARGLDYAHRLTDGQGRPAQIVHRDVSPANIMVTYTGDVKLADFGIARAAQHLRQTATEAGEIKGKIRYMSPEQARGETVDARTDLFALGTVLLELMTLRPAFAGESDIASLLQVQAGVPNDWEQRKRTIPPDVLPIVLKAMAVSKEERFSTGEELAAACELTLRRRNPGFGPSKLAAYMRSMFSKEQAQWRERISRYEREAAQPEDAMDAAPRTPITARVSGMNPPPSGAGSQPQSGSASMATGEMAGPVQTPARPRAVLLAGAAVAFALGGVGIVAFLKGHAPRPAAPPAAVAAPPVAAPPVAAPPVAAPPVAAPTVAAPVEPKPGRLVLSTNALGTRVFLDGNGVPKSISPVAAGGMSYKVDVPSGKVWTLRIEADGYRTLTMPLVIGPGEETTLPVVMVPEQPQAAPKKAVAHAKRPAAAPVEKPVEAPPPAKPTGNENIVNPF